MKTEEIINGIVRDFTKVAPRHKSEIRARCEALAKAAGEEQYKRGVIDGREKERNRPEYKPQRNRGRSLGTIAGYDVFDSSQQSNTDLRYEPAPGISFTVEQLREYAILMQQNRVEDINIPSRNGTYNLTTTEIVRAIHLIEQQSQIEEY